jgi:hypothetical protein
MPDVPVSLPLDIGWPVERSFVPLVIALWIRRTSLVDIIHCEETPRGYRTRYLLHVVSSLKPRQISSDLHTYIASMIHTIGKAEQPSTYRLIFLPRAFPPITRQPRHDEP